jgi:hypothetical protein
MSKKSSRGGRRTIPYAFTQEGVAMLSSVLKSERAREINIAIQRTFASLRKGSEFSFQMTEKIDQLETSLNLKIAEISGHVQQVIVAVEALPKRDIVASVSSPAQLSSSDFSVMEAQVSNSDYLKKPRNLRIEEIQNAVSHYFQVSVLDLNSGSRSASIVQPRQICMFLIRKFCGLSYKKIGAIFGGCQLLKALSIKISKNRLLLRFFSANVFLVLFV